MNDLTAFARLIDALDAWRGHLVIVGGWAHRLYRFHPLATDPGHAPIATRDVDLALSLTAPLEGDIRAALAGAGFTPEFVGDHTPPVTHYRLADEGGFYAEFLATLRGSEYTRRGKPDVTALKAGISAQKLRHVDVLMTAPWSVRIGAGVDVPTKRPANVLIANPSSFIVQKLLIHHNRPPAKRAQDVLYIHDTLELLGGALDELRKIWVDSIKPALPAKTVRTMLATATEISANVSDTIREAARIPQDRRLAPENVRAACEYGLEQILVER